MNLDQAISSLSGFKIPDTHFRIGSKIHISDFYYAKRFFQNGFFSSRIAFLVAEQILRTLEEQQLEHSVSSEGLTIVGYEMYSELLISLVDKFLRKRLGLKSDKVNHNLYEDFSNLKLCKQNNLLKHVVIIVPIASTFSTAIKIEQQILLDQRRAGRDGTIIIRPHFNVLYIENELSDPNSLSKLEESFNWISKDPVSRTITVEALYTGAATDPRPQRYFLTLPSKWYAVENCGRCHPVQEVKYPDAELLEYGMEQPLYETDQTSVTPAVVFDFPKGRKISETDLERKYLLDEDIISYGHQKRNDSHFLYAVNTEAFLERNYVAIRDWLIAKKKEMIANGSYRESLRVVIVANCHFSNVSFISMVNDFVFGSSANILHYDPASDYVQNFAIVHGREVDIADKIFFVDDSLKSGTHFERIHQFVQNTVTSKKKGINGCFLLLNKSQGYTMANVNSRMLPGAQVHAFANLHLHTSLKPFEPSPLEQEKVRYASIVENSMLEVLKGHFQTQSTKLEVAEVHKVRPSDPQKLKRHQQMLVATHRIFQYFSVESDPVLDSFEAFFMDLTKKTDLMLSKPLAVDVDMRMAYLKVLTQSPFVQFKKLKDRVFNWVLEILFQELGTASAALRDGSFTYGQFASLKFYIRRAGLLNSNFLISVRFMEFLLDLYAGNGIPKLMRDAQQEAIEACMLIDELKRKHAMEGPPGVDMFKMKVRDQEVSEIEAAARTVAESRAAYLKLKNFHVFYIAQVKELVLKNESRCLKVQANLDLLTGGEKYRAASTSLFFEQILRMLKEENAVLFKLFYDHLSQNERWPKLYVPDDLLEEQVIDYTNDKISEFILSGQFSQHHKAQNLTSFLELLGQSDILSNDGLLNYLWIEYFLGYDKAKRISLHLKTGVVLSKLIEIFKGLGTVELGAFFVVNDSNGRPFVAFNQAHTGIKEIDDDRLTDEKGLLSEFMNGMERPGKVETQLDGLLEFATGKIPERKYPGKTVVELCRNGQNRWEDMYSTNGEDREVENLGAGFVPMVYDRIILVRLNKRTKSGPAGKAQGVIGFYYTAPLESAAKINIDFVMYLLLLRPSLSRFIQNHHESDEFRDWQIAEIKQRTSLLTGHGRDMLINIALNRGIIYKNIVTTLLTVQRFLIDKNEEADSFCGGNSRVTDIFRMYYRNPKVVVNKRFFEKEIVDLARDIFLFDEIENKEEIEEPILVYNGTGDFAFDRSLLKMMCFELLVNAKKNRWLFLDQPLIVGEQVFTRNQIWITVDLRTDGLMVTIANTGARVEDMTKVKRLKNIKKYDNSSGVEMISNMLSSFELGTLELDQEPLAGRFSKFMATLFLKDNKLAADAEDRTD